MSFKSGFATVVGRPNVGKSTLINKLVGQKINIISDKPQTTRNQIKTIFNSERGQIIFVDTPGIHKPKNELDEYMLKQAYKSLEGIDIILFMVEATSSFGRGDNFILKQIKGQDNRIIVVLNKVDRLDKKTLITRKQHYEQKTGLEVIPVSAASGDNIDFLLDIIFSDLSEGPRYYPEDMITDQIERFVISEMIREKLFQLLRQEIPYGTAVVIEEVKERDNGMIYVRGNIFVEKKSHKGIIIGHKGRMLKKIGHRARQDVEKLLQADVYLDLWVKVQKDWRNNKYLLKQMGYKE